MINSIVETKTSMFLESIRNHKPCRITKNLDNGNMAILQIVNPDDVSQITKSIRLLPGTVGRFLKSIEAACRVGFIVYRNSMKKRK
jgi:hypothetical protein